MINPYPIWVIARGEARLLWRSWAFRLSIGFCVFVLFFYNLLMSAPGIGAPHPFVSLAGVFPLGNVKLLNLYLGIVAAFLATEFVKRDRQQDTVQTVLVHSFTNVDYVAGKVLGVVLVFSTLELAVLGIAAVLHRFFAPAPFAWQPYILAGLVAALPTLVFTIGLAILLVTLLRNQALVFVLMVGLGMLFLAGLGYRFHYFYDTFAFHIPMMWSDFVGPGNLRQLLLVRGTHLLFGLGCLALAPLLSTRLRQSRLANIGAGLAAVCCLGGAGWTGTAYLQGRWAALEYRQELRTVSRQAAKLPAPSLAECQLRVERAGGGLAVLADLVVTNESDTPLDTLIFTLNPGLVIGEITSAGETQPFRRREHLLRVAPLTALSPGDTCHLHMTYSGSIDERFCYLDVEEERYEGPYRWWLHSTPKRYAFTTPDFLHLTPESGWYPRSGIPPGAAYPAAGHRDYARYRVSVVPPPGHTAISQGSVRVDSVTGTHTFTTETPLPQVSLTVGEYERRQLTVDDVVYALAIRPDHAYFDAYLDSVGPALPELIRELRSEYEAALGLDYPHPRFSLVEVPIQFFSYDRLWTVAQETVQPELVFLPEMGTLCDGGDFRRAKRRSRHTQEWANQAESAEDLQSDYVRAFVTLDLLGLQDPGPTQAHRSSWLETRYKVLPDFLSHVTHLSSARWPVLNYAFESYFLERVAPPQNTRRRRWAGLTEREEANLALRETSLAELLADYEQPRRIREGAINAKGRHLLQLFAASLGPERFGTRLTAAVEESRYRGLSEQQLMDFIRGLGESAPETLIDHWYSSSVLPGYEVERAESYLVRDGERTRTQVELDLANPTEVDGLVEVSFRYRQTETEPWWLRQGPQADYAQVVSMPAGVRKKLGMVVDRPVAEVMLDTYVSRNIPSLITIPFQEQKLRRRARPVTGETEERLADDPAPGAAEYIVDNEDEGFTVRETEQANWLRQVLAEWLNLRERRVPYVGLRHWDAPGTWQPTTDRRFYGQFVLSGYYKRTGDGRSAVSWRAEIARTGNYDLYFHCGITDSDGRGRHWSPRKAGRSLSLQVFHEGGVEPVQLDMTQVEAGWNHLGTYRLDAGPAHVELSDLGKGSMVVADAVKWVERP